MESAQPRVMTLADYFRMEETAERKSEFFDGEVFAMAGASIAHNLIAANVTAALHRALAAGPCRVFPGDMRVEVSPGHHYAYPDVSVVCGEIQRGAGRDDTIANPRLIVEILSASTRDYDRGSKFTAYRGIPALADYVLIDQYTIHVEHYGRTDDRKWWLTDHRRIDEVLELTSLAVRLPLSKIYHRVRPAARSPQSP